MRSTPYKKISVPDKNKIIFPNCLRIINIAAVKVEQKSKFSLFCEIN